ncbi:dihydrodipicolinate synthase family protein [Microbacterium sp. ZW T5_56]|uniref:dihydrodipicolinate synthase family protein n=1 Tax=Microbacterium sp. ZW T5_56 TaxID=3378081 RepID=UPI00385398CC
MFTGLSAFPLTPLRDDTVDERAFIALMERLVMAGVDSITALGSTGAAAYLSTAERERVARLAVEHAGDVPVVIGVGALRTSDVLANVAHAEAAGARGLLLAPMSYVPLSPDDVFGLFRAVSDATELPVIVYDNPGTTHVTFTTELYARICALPGIASLKIPGVPSDPDAARAHVAAIRASIPSHVTIGVSGDAFGAAGLIAGCDAWYTAVGGTLPVPTLTITRAVQRGRAEDALRESERLAPLWDLFARFGGSSRVIAVIAEQLGLAPRGCLPLPIQPLDDADRHLIHRVMTELELN